jgi:hypothetical protein
MLTESFTARDSLETFNGTLLDRPSAISRGAGERGE